MITYIIIFIYLSFALDFIVWPVASEASTGQLISGRASLINKIMLVVVYAVNLIFFSFPLLLAIGCLIDGAYNAGLLSWLGIPIALMGRVISILGTLALRNSPGDSPVTHSIFRYTRNPITLGIHLTSIGLILCFNHWYLWAGLLFSVVNLHVKIKIEERNLFQVFKESYTLYFQKTPRYLIW